MIQCGNKCGAIFLHFPFNINIHFPHENNEKYINCINDWIFLLFLPLMKKIRETTEKYEMEADDLWSYVPIPDIIYFHACLWHIDPFFHFFSSLFSFHIFYYRLHSLFCSFFAAQIVIIFPSRINYRRWINERRWKRISYVSIKNYFHHFFSHIFNDVCWIIHFFFFSLLTFRCDALSSLQIFACTWRKKGILNGNGLVDVKEGKTSSSLKCHE